MHCTQSRARATNAMQPSRSRQQTPLVWLSFWCNTVKHCSLVLSQRSHALHIDNSHSHLFYPPQCTGGFSITAHHHGVCEAEGHSPLLPSHRCHAVPPESAIWLGWIPTVPRPVNAPRERHVARGGGDVRNAYKHDGGNRQLPTVRDSRNCWAEWLLPLHFNVILNVYEKKKQPSWLQRQWCDLIIN